MTFDDALKETEIDITGEVNRGWHYDNFSQEENTYVGGGVEDAQQHFSEVIEKLKDEYAPTIEMTQTQYNFLMGSDGLVDIIGNISVDGIVKEYFDEDFWKPLNERDVANAWLHPETIKVKN